MSRYDSAAFVKPPSLTSWGPIGVAEVMMHFRNAVSISDTTRALVDGAEQLTAPESTFPLLIAERSKERPILVITHSSHHASALVRNLTSFADSVAEFPAWETLPHERLSPNSDTIAHRIDTLLRMSEHRIIVAPIRSVIQPVLTNAISLPLIELELGKKIDFTYLVAQLQLRAYSRVDLVERRGDFAVRGGIIDIFPPIGDHPVRIEFFGDEIEEMRFFEVGDQRTFAPVIGTLRLIPCRELLIDDVVREKAKALRDFIEIREMCDKIADGIYVDGLESLSGVLSDSQENLINLLPANVEVFVIEPNRVINRVLDLVKTDQEFFEAAWSNLAFGGKGPHPLSEELRGGGFRTYLEISELAATKDIPWRTIDATPGFDSTTLSDYLPITNFKNDFEKLARELRSKLNTGYLVILTLRSPGLVERYSQLLGEADLPTRPIQDFNTAPVRDVIYLLTTPLDYGFEDIQKKIFIVADSDITGVADRRTSRMPSRRKKTIDPLELRRGDYVVHEIHGVGRYLELIKRQVSGVEREYLVIEYASSKRGQPADRIFVPTESLELITRYVGGDSPSINRIGSGEWIKAKSRAKKAVREIAGELIRLYAARRSSPGFAFSQDTTWQRELEDSFEYVETPDQLTVINEVKSDMQQPYPMDRIVCGDVGYGKTEIAIRAAFKAVQDAKQVAVLVPTTLLAQQHSATFAERYSGFPLQVRALSRFNSAKEISETLAGLKSGTVDVVIGTHRLLSDDVQFKDLGLVIVDEEQRFGVEHKEKLKKLRTSVDVLSMSATPIPRTLEMAITGIREMSTITTPPEERHPVLTYVGHYDEKQVVAAIHREMMRDGQVFYIHNRVESIDEIAIRLQKLIPEARIGIAHGQMNESALEQVVIAFWNKEFDVLVCTTIVENGIDVPNANTLIVDRADVFGLSQLHQLRGRVGRSRERAYAYFLYPSDKPLSETALDRLSTIAKNTELGSGMQVALKDLEIRGAGNLLGGEQSGHIQEVGFDLYMRMVGEAVSEFKRGIVTKDEEEEVECKVEIPVSAHLSYVTSDRLRLDLYRRLADAKNEDEIEMIREELQDRFGELPLEALTLLRVAGLRVFAKQHGVSEIALQGRYVKISPCKLSESQEMRINRLYPGSIVKSITNVLLIARPMKSAWETQSGNELHSEDAALLDWVMSALEIALPRNREEKP